MIDIIERILEERRSAGLRGTLEKARGKADEIAFLICEIDEADQLHHDRSARKKAEDCSRLSRAIIRHRPSGEVFREWRRSGARIGVLEQYRRPINDERWIPFSVLAFGLAFFGVMTAVIAIYLRGTAIVIDIEDPGVAVRVNGSDVIITGPKNEKVTVTPGDQGLYDYLRRPEAAHQKPHSQKGQKRTVTVSIVNKDSRSAG